MINPLLCLQSCLDNQLTNVCTIIFSMSCKVCVYGSLIFTSALNFKPNKAICTYMQRTLALLISVSFALVFHMLIHTLHKHFTGKVPIFVRNF